MIISSSLLCSSMISDLKFVRIAQSEGCKTRRLTHVHYRTMPATKTPPEMTLAVPARRETHPNTNTLQKLPIEIRILIFAMLLPVTCDGSHARLPNFIIALRGNLRVYHEAIEGLLQKVQSRARYYGKPRQLSLCFRE